MKYNVSFVRNEVSQSNIAIADNEMAVMAWFKMYKPDARILTVFPAKPDDEKPGKPCIEIPQNYLPYMNAADNMSLILQHEKSMSCCFYVMDKAYYGNLAYPQLSADNRGHALVIGDWYVIVTCSNGYKYYINVSGDSVVTMCAETFDFIQNK